MDILKQGLDQRIEIEIESTPFTLGSIENILNGNVTLLKIRDFFTERKLIFSLTPFVPLEGRGNPS